ncbi:hypothetical protein A6456_37450 [Paraburkholderia tropica]|nr:hypothetical protein A6456_37450 [Paraburkholderia tropica]
MAFMGGLVPRAAVATTVLGTVGATWLGWNEWRGRALFAQQFASERGQVLKVDLPDGSHIDLDTQTHIAVQLYRDRREVVLAEGQAMFSVQANPDCPFHVLASNVRVTVVGTQFLVRHTSAGVDAGMTRVAVEHGRVRVARVGHPDVTIELTRGQAVVADTLGQLGPIQTVSPDQPAPWRTGRINFEATPLVEALAEFERYVPTHVVVRDPSIAALRVGGSFDIDDVQGFLRVLPQQLPVRLRRTGGVTELIRAA